MNKKEVKKKSLKRNLVEWGIIIAVGATLYFTGSYTVVIGKVQQVVLYTGLLQSDIQIPAAQQKPADYDLRLISFDEMPTSLYNFKGKTIFLNFWASWCPPCRAEMPTIQKLYNDTKDKKEVAFVLVTLDNDLSKAKKFIKDEGFTFPVYYLNGYRPQVYVTGTIPTTFIISPGGKIVAKRTGMYDYDTEEFKKFISDLSN